jgi:hypothetical protein
MFLIVFEIPSFPSSYSKYEKNLQTKGFTLVRPEGLSTAHVMNTAF